MLFAKIAIHHLLLLLHHVCGTCWIGIDYWDFFSVILSFGLFAGDWNWRWHWRIGTNIWIEWICWKLDSLVLHAHSREKIIHSIVRSDICCITLILISELVVSILIITFILTVSSTTTSGHATKPAQKGLQIRSSTLTLSTCSISNFWPIVGNNSHKQLLKLWLIHLLQICLMWEELIGILLHASLHIVFVIVVTLTSHIFVLVVIITLASFAAHATKSTFSFLAISIVFLVGLVSFILVSAFVSLLLILATAKSFICAAVLALAFWLILDTTFSCLGRLTSRISWFLLILVILISLIGRIHFLASPWIGSTFTSWHILILMCFQQRCPLFKFFWF